MSDAESGDTILFDPLVFPPASPALISLATLLPILDDGDVTIDASNAGVIMDGGAGSERVDDGFLIRSSGNIVRGLHLRFFEGDGFDIGAGANDNIIGGDRNLGSGPSGQGNIVTQVTDAAIQIDSSGNLVIGNSLGTADGVTSLANKFGVVLRNGASGNTIGGATPGERNLISGNSDEGIFITSGASSNVVVNNLIGLDGSGEAALPNLMHGVRIDQGAHDNLIGPLNQVAFNVMGGILVDQSGSEGNVITANSIHSNLVAGIQDANGGNRELAPPVIAQVTDGVRVAGTACAGCTVEVFSDADGQGRYYEGAATAGGDGEFTFVAPCGLTGPNITATATDADGNSSIFSGPVVRSDGDAYCHFLPAALSH